MADPASDQKNPTTVNPLQTSPGGKTWEPSTSDWSQPPTNQPLMSTVPVSEPDAQPSPVQPVSTQGLPTPEPIPSGNTMPSAAPIAAETPLTVPPATETPLMASVRTVNLPSDQLVPPPLNPPTPIPPPLTLSPGGETMTSGLTLEPSPPPKGGGKKKLLVIVLILLVLGVLVLVGLVVLSQTLLRPTPVTGPETSPEASASAQAVLLTSAPDLLYMKAGNVYQYLQTTNTESQLTNDGGPQVSYKLPKWFDETTFTLVRCGEKSADGKAPYTCDILRQQLSGATPVELATLSSRPNKNGVHEGDIQLYAWDKNKIQLAYLNYEATTGSATIGSYKLYYQESTASAVRVLKEFPTAGGRGGSLDDATALEFSPDANRLLFNFTSLYPATDNDEGTLFIFDLPSKQQIWALPKAWTTFAHWLSGNIIIAKQQSQDESDNAKQWQLIRIDLTKGTTDPQSAVEQIVEVPTWFGVEPLSQQVVVFSEVGTSTGSGILLGQMNLETKSKKTLRENILKLKVIDETTLLVRNMASCLPDCGPFDLYNGVADNQTGLFDMTKLEFTPLTIATDSAQPTDFDIR